MPAKTKSQRDVSRIVALAKKGAASTDILDAQAIFTQIADIGIALDARTGRRDPRLRKGKKSAPRKAKA